jgi:hypothetical protein
VSPRRTSRLAGEVALALVALLGAAWWLFTRSVYGGPTELRAANPIALATAAEDAIVEQVSGHVQRSTAQGDWAAVAAGERLRADDSLRTDKGARTDLRIGDRARLTVTESSQVTIRELTSKVHRFQLARGRVKADYKPDGQRVLRIESEGGVAEARGARFSMLSTGTAVAIATDAGAVTLRAQDRAVEVGAGEQAVAVLGRAPAASEPIPARVLLKLANAAAPADGLCATVAGVAPAGTEVTVDGAAAPLAEDGHFRVHVPRERDRREVLVALRDAAGRQETRTVACIDGPPQIRDFAIHWRTQTP